MGKCPLCGESTNISSTRLIKDSCGHSKCRICLIKEENGCTLCVGLQIEKTPQRVEIVGYCDETFSTKGTSFCKNEIRVNQENTIHEINGDYEDCPSVEGELVIDEDSERNIETNGVDQSQNNCNEKNQKDQNNIIEINENGIDNMENAEDEPHKTSNVLSSTNCHPFETRIESWEDQNEFGEESQYEIEDYDELITSTIIINKSPSKSPRVNCTSIDENFKTDEIIILDSKTPNYYATYKSPEFRIQDYLIFRKHNYKPFLSPQRSPDIQRNDHFKLPSPAQSTGYISPEHQIIDCASFKNKCNNQLFQLVFNRSLGKTSHIVSSVIDETEQEYNSSKTIEDGSSNTSNSNANIEESTKNINEGTTELDNGDSSSNENYVDFMNTVEDNSDKEIEGFEPTTASKKQEDNNIEKMEVAEINQKIRAVNTEKDNIKTEIVVEERNEIQVTKKIDDEDKENEIKHSEPEEQKSKIINISNNASEKINKKFTNKDEQKRKKNVPSTKLKSIEKNHTGKKKQKSKVLLTEDEDVKINFKPFIKRRKQNRDWSHIITLPGEPIIYKCTVCEKTFKVLLGRKYHATCLTGKAPYTCNICNRKFAKRSHFEYHERVHTGVKPFECNMCGKRFIQRNKLNRHVMIHKQFCDIECNECGKKFSTKAYLKNHLHIHTNNSYKCTFCPKTFTHDHNRKRHEHSHSTDKPFQCEICNKQFKNKFLLTRHKRIHDKSRPFCCHHCNKLFLSKFEVKRHMSVHSDAKPFQCKDCDLFFRRKDNLRRHIRHHHMEQLITKTIRNIDTENIIQNPIQSEEKEDQTSKFHIIESERHVRVERQEKEKDYEEKVKEKPKPKKISRSNSTFSEKNLSKSPRRFTVISPRPMAATPTDLATVIRETLPDTNNSMTIISSPINIQRFDETHVNVRSLIEPIPLEKVIDLNKQIEERLYNQGSFLCDFPGLTRKTSLNHGRRDSTGSNSNSNDGINFAKKQNQEKPKTGQSSKEKQSNAQNDDHNVVRKDLHVHWRRRTAETLKSKMSKN